MQAVQVRFGSLVPATFVRRDNRFRVRVRTEGGIEAAHLPNSGRLSELLVPGRRVWLAPAKVGRRRYRRTSYDLSLVEFEDRLVSVDARLPGHLVAEALRLDQLAGFKGYSSVRQEASLGRSRLDFRLDSDAERPCWLEVKSVTLVEGSTARFPDAPTRRGQRQVRALIRAVEQGDRAAAIFVVQRDDAAQFTPHDEADPAFGRVLRQAAQSGVEVHAFRCRVNRKAIRLVAVVPVVL
jgi:sugar fermentation stimulation protein A